MDPHIPQMLPLANLNWEVLVPMIGRASRAISRYDGLLQGIPSPNVMLAPLTSQEAVLSSKIEGTRATLGEVLQYDAGHAPQEKGKLEDILEIHNYRLALMYAKTELVRRKFSLNFLKELHRILLSSVRGKNKNPGQFRTQQNRIGKPGTSIEEASFIPPPPHLIQDFLDNLIGYYHLDRPDPLVQLAILHAQFEIIHPFDDGNGRLGRMLIPLFLYGNNLLCEPMFYLSAYLEQHRDEYIACLRPLGKEPAAWDAWILFFLQAIEKQSEENIKITKAILALYEQLKKEILSLTHSQYAIPVLDYMFSKPAFRPIDMAKQDNMPSRAQLSSHFAKLKQAGIITVLVHGRGRQPEVLLLKSLFELCEGRSATFATGTNNTSIIRP